MKENDCWLWGFWGKKPENKKIKPVEDEKSLWVRAEVHPTQNIVWFAWYLEEQFKEMYSMEDNMLDIFLPVNNEEVKLWNE